MSKFINIEICKGYVNGTYNLRIGNITGSTEHSNILIDEVLSDIKDEVLEKFIVENSKVSGGKDE